DAASRIRKGKTMSVTTERPTAISLPQPAGPRLRLPPDRPGSALLDGGWWPRSADPAAELPGLVLALDERHGRITRIMLGMIGWDASRPSRLAVGGRVVRLGWFASMPVGRVTAISASGQRTDLVTIPPHVSEQAAAAAMRHATRAGNRDHAPAILAAITLAEGATVGKAAGSSQLSAWEWEGGQLPGRAGA
ncbi:MAG TPA: DUF5994 family protein, partial [Trebonia sp.]